MARGENGRSDGGGAPDAAVDPDAGGRAEVVRPSLPYAHRLVDFSPGEGAGFGGDQLPGAILGPPSGGGGIAGGEQVVSLGDGGDITLAFGDRTIVDGEGADFIVFENAFYAGGDPEQVFQELGEVSVSADGEEWETIGCDTEPAEPGRWPGCAGWRPVEDYDPESVVPLEPAITGGDPFDLADVDLDEARYVRIRDLSGRGPAPKVGFDLDAVGIIHASADSTTR